MLIQNLEEQRLQLGIIDTQIKVLGLALSTISGTGPYSNNLDRAKDVVAIYDSYIEAINKNMEKE